MMTLELKFSHSSVSRIQLQHGLLSRIAAILAEHSPTRVAVLADQRVLELHGVELLGPFNNAGIEGIVLEIQPGEQSKSRGTVAELQDRLLESGFDRKGMIVGFGGGVTLDIAGYVAATLLRGVNWISIPTSLLAQVDAGVGGKTGVNTPSGKNLVGAFHPPADVIIDPSLLDTLPAVEWRNGLAEVVKHAWIADSVLFDTLESKAVDLMDGTASSAADWIERAVRVKTSVVSEDPFELSRRAILNAGHTIGHAIEAASGHRVKHGFAVASGLIAEAAVAVETTDLKLESVNRLRAILQQLGLLPAESKTFSFEELAPFIKTDKKNEGDTVRLALPTELGRMAEGSDGSWTHPVSMEQLNRGWEIVR
jgi:3-dehydroquinate synthase